MAIENRLKQYMNDNGIKQIWLAEKAKISKTTLSNIVNSRHLPSVEVAIRISRAIGKPIEEIWIVSDTE
jgi:putative transcriptional regulator